MEYPQSSLQTKIKPLIHISKCTQNMYPSYHSLMLFNNLHQLSNHATPSKICLYKHALLLYNIVNNNEPPLDMNDLKFQQIFNHRCKTLRVF